MVESFCTNCGCPGVSEMCDSCKEGEEEIVHPKIGSTLLTTEPPQQFDNVDEAMAAMRDKGHVREELRDIHGGKVVAMPQRSGISEDAFLAFMGLLGQSCPNLKAAIAHKKSTAEAQSKGPLEIGPIDHCMECGRFDTHSHSNGYVFLASRKTEPIEPTFMDFVRWLDSQRGQENSWPITREMIFDFVKEHNGDA